MIEGNKGLMEKVKHGAYVGYGYTLKRNSRTHGCSYITVSRIIRRVEGEK